MIKGCAEIDNVLIICGHFVCIHMCAKSCFIVMYHGFLSSSVSDLSSSFETFVFIVLAGVLLGHSFLCVALSVLGWDFVLLLDWSYLFWNVLKTLFLSLMIINVLEICVNFVL